ncbi:MAG: nitroreductase family protein, partial [Candidatus Cloacimonetes bacterium]|nr:nitroreductase family protein [Candidatus Cloacimonadota bacterium]
MKIKITAMIVLTILSITLLLARQPKPNPILEFISSVYSTRQFSSSFMSDDSIQKIISAGHKAPSAMNAQPWHFSVIREGELCKAIMPNIVENNVLIVVSGTESGRWVDFDTALATQNMFLAAQALEI